MWVCDKMKLKLNDEWDEEGHIQKIDVNYWSFFKFFILGVLTSYAILFVIGFILGLTGIL